MAKPQIIIETSKASTTHPDYDVKSNDWSRVRDCIEGETKIKSEKTKYLPQPEGMQNEYANAYEAYRERAHFPLITSYALQGTLGIIISKLPEFNLPPKLKYLETSATKTGQTLQQLFLDIIIEIMQTGRCPLLIDIVPSKNQFRFVKYKAESFINWKTAVQDEKKDVILGVLKEKVPEDEDIFSHDTEDNYRVLYFNSAGEYTTSVYDDDGVISGRTRVPKFMGKTIKEIPLIVAGSIDNSIEVQPIPLLATANCAIQIYRKEADLANSEFLSCNPTLVFSGASNDEGIPNVVGSSVLICLPDPQARAYYTKTDTAALTHVSSHIEALYEEGIRHGVSILDSRKGVESAEALRIRQATQSASIYSVYLSAVTAIQKGIDMMQAWGNISGESSVDAPTTLTFGIPESELIREMVDGFIRKSVPISSVHRYLVNTGLLDQKVSVEEYIKSLEEGDHLRPELPSPEDNKGGFPTKKKEEPKDKK